jgi:hypothetical protein
MKRRVVLMMSVALVGSFAGVTAQRGPAAGPTIEVYKSPT